MAGLKLAIVPPVHTTGKHDAQAHFHARANCSQRQLSTITLNLCKGKVQENPLIMITGSATIAEGPDLPAVRACSRS